MEEIEVKRVMLADDPDFGESLHLLRRDSRLDPNQVDTPEDVYRWMREFEVERLVPTAACEDRFLVAKIPSHGVVGLLFYEHYRADRWLYIWFLVVQRRSSVHLHTRVSRSLLDWMHRDMEEVGARGILYELNLDEHHDAKDLLFRQHIAERGMQLRRMPFLQPALSVKDQNYSPEQLQLHIVTAPNADAPKRDQVVEFMYEEVYRWQDGGDAAYLRHLAVVRKTQHHSATSPGVAAFNIVEKTERRRESFGYVDRLTRNGRRAPRPCSRAWATKLRNQSADYDMFIDEPKKELYVRGKRHPLKKLGAPGRTLLWMILTHVGDEVAHDAFRSRLPSKVAKESVHTYRHRLRRYLDASLLDLVLKADRSQARWLVPDEGWSFCWLRRRRDPEEQSELLR